MDNRTNTIAGWVLAGGILALGATIVTGEIFHAERPEKMGYPIEGVVEEGEGGAAEAEPPIANLLASADVAAGEQVFKKCAACHTVTPGGPNLVGPNIYGVVGKPLAHLGGGFPYSDALKSKGGNWDFDALNHWLKSPKDFVPGTKMTFAGLGKPQDRANLIAWLNTQGSNVALPAPVATPAAAEGNPAQAAAEAAGAPAADGKGEKEPVLTEAQAAAGAGKNIKGEGAPAVDGRAAQEAPVKK